MRSISKRYAFTMIELLFVIVILGIVGSVALSAIKEYFESSILTLEVDKRVAQADAALEQIAPYFENGVADSITRLGLAGAVTCFGPPDGNDANDRAIAFVSVDVDSRRGAWDTTLSTYLPGWSEDVDIAGNVLTSIGANYNYANAIIGEYYPGNTIEDSVVYNANRVDLDPTECSSFRWDGTGSGDAYMDVTAHTQNTLTFTWPTNVVPVNGASSGRHLLTTAYAFEVNSAGEFRMYNDFRPWLGEVKTNGKSFVIVNNAASFTIAYDRSNTAALDGMNSQKGMFYTMKLCMNGLSDNDLNVSTSASTICRQRSVHVRY